MRHFNVKDYVMKNVILIALAPLLIASAKPGTYPDLKDGWLDAPEVVSVDTVRGVLIGMSRHQVYHQLGEPHFNEGIGARTWNYALDLRSKGQSTGQMCEMQIVYEARRVAQITWKTESCANAVK